MRRLTLLLLCLFCGPAAPVAARAPDCEALAAAAERKHDLPPGLLRAIARTESGRRAEGGGRRAWPWTANVAGKGMYFDDAGKAIAHLSDLAARGMENFDVGCMQLNYRWHGDHFASVEDMIEPARNTEYAARYLKDLRSETGTWDDATKYYHSRDPERGTAYLGRVRAALSGIDTSQPVAIPVSVPASRGSMDGAATGLDRRFEPAAPLIRRQASHQYWAHPALPAGALPKLPGRETKESQPESFGQ